jgi:uroporphyrinogen-III synthase
MRPLVILRPEPGASATAEAARKLGLQPVLMPVFAAEALEWEAPGSSAFDALLFTSANAIRHGGAGLRQLQALPAYCVGEATAAAARHEGFDVRAVGNGGVDALLRSLPGRQKLLHLCGAHWHEPRDERHSIHHLPVYASVELPRPPAMERLEGAVVALHSRRAAAAFSRLVGEAELKRKRIAIAAMSAATAEAAGEGWARVVCASEPTDAALLSLAAELCDNRE